MQGVLYIVYLCIPYIVIVEVYKWLSFYHLTYAVPPAGVEILIVNNQYIHMKIRQNLFSIFPELFYFSYNWFSICLFQEETYSNHIYMIVLSGVYVNI